MKLEQLAISTTPKSSWQCFDLGCKVALKHYTILLSFWLIVSFPFFIFSCFLSLEWGLLIFWLFKPWYERGLLFILSRAVFSNFINLKTALLAWPEQIKPLWFASITYRRLAPSRSFDMAVTQLERLSGKKRANRLNVLHRSKDDNTGWWTVLCVHWEGILMVGILVMLSMLLPTEMDLWSFLFFSEYEEDVFWSLLISNIVVYLCAAFVAPFYVAGGFIAYLNRRMILEAWDLEIGFKKWVSAAKSKGASLGATALPLLGCFLLVFAQTVFQPVFAQITEENSEGRISLEPELESTAIIVNNKQEDTEPNLEAKTKIREELNLLFDEEPFSTKETIVYYRWKGSDEDAEEEYSSEGFSGFSTLANFIASFLELFLWAAFALTFGYIVVKNWSKLANILNQNQTTIEDLPLPSFISKAFNESMPEDVSFAVNQAIIAQDFRRALSILVRASLMQLSREQKVHITKSMTENECLMAIKQTSTKHIHDFMTTLMRAWISMAWAHHIPSADQLTALLASYELTLISDLNNVDQNMQVSESLKDKENVKGNEE